MNRADNTRLKMTTKELKARANNYLQNPTCKDDLNVIISVLKNNLANSGSITPCLLVLEHLFAELFKRLETESGDDWKPEYEDVFACTRTGMQLERVSESQQALVTGMKLIACEARAANTFPVDKLKAILDCILVSKTNTSHLGGRFSDYTRYPDILSQTWKLMPQLTPRGSSPSELFTMNYLNLINTLPITKEVQQAESFCMKKAHFSYPEVRKALNKVWSCVIVWRHSETSLKQLLIVLLEKILEHLDKPILLTDLLMESLDMGGTIGLLALQGIFILIHKHNLTYENIYEKLYSMFEPEIFHTKFKARLFYLADIFLSSSHLPEALVAAFAKRLARLALVAPPQDITIIVYFVGNLILRHPGLKRLMFYPTAGFVSRDPFVMEERDPLKSRALESQLWEIQALQSHGIPSIASAAKFISNPLPSIEWDLSSVLEVNENDIFDIEISRKTKEYALSFERPLLPNMLPKSDRTMQFWNLV